MPITLRRTLIPAACVLTLILVGACRKPSAAEHTRRGNELFDKQDFSQAIIEYRTALQANPKLGATRLKLAEAYAKVKDLKNAMREYVRAADLLPANVEAQIRAGNVLLLARAFEDAKARAERAIAIDPKNTQAQILRGNALAGLKDLDGAMTEYQEAIALDPKQTDAYTNLASLQYAKGQREEAEATFKKAVDAAPQSLEARLALANFYWASQRTEESETVLKTAHALDPKHPMANRALGVFYLATKRSAEAEPYFVALNASKSTESTSLTLADYYTSVARYDDARRVLSELATHEASLATATVRLAAIDAREGQRAQALERIRGLLAKQPKHAAALFMSARLLLADGKRDEALTAAQAVVANEPASQTAAAAHQLAGGIHAATDHLDDAIKSYEEVLKLQPRPYTASLALARLHLMKGAVDKSFTYTQQALAIQPDNPDAKAFLVRVQVGRGELAKAIEEVAALEKAYPTVSTVYNLKALTQLASKQTEAARASYAQALQLTPQDREALAGLSRLDVATGHAREATTRVDARLTEPSPDASTLLMAARTYGAAGDLEKMEKTLRRAIDADPARLQAYGLLAQLYLRQNRLPEAEKNYREVIARNPRSVSASTMLGMLYYQQGRLQEAEKEYQRILAVDAGAAVAANNLACIYLDANRSMDEALQLAQTAQQRLPDEPHVNDTLGWIYFKKNMLPKAIEHLEASVKKLPKDATVQYHLGMAYKQSGNWEKARLSLTEALTLKPDFEGAADAKKALTVIGT